MGLKSILLLYALLKYEGEHSDVSNDGARTFETENTEVHVRGK